MIIFVSSVSDGTGAGVSAGASGADEEAVWWDATSWSDADTVGGGWREHHWHWVQSTNTQHGLVNTDWQGTYLTYFLTYLTSSPANFVTYFDTPRHIKLLVQFVVYCHIVVNGYQVMQGCCLSHYWKYVTSVSTCCTSIGWMCNTHLSSSFNKQQRHPICFHIGPCFCSIHCRGPH